MATIGNGADAPTTADVVGNNVVALLCDCMGMYCLIVRIQSCMRMYLYEYASIIMLL